VRRWWRSHSLRMRLTLWSVGAMVVVLGVYVVAVYSILRQNMFDALDEQLRRDFGWANATVDYSSEGGFEWVDPEIVVGDDPPWVQVWTADGTQLLVSSAEARRRPIPESQALALQPERIVAVPTDESTYRILTGRGAFQTRRGAVTDLPYIVQVARPDAATRIRLRELSALLALGLPLAVAVAGLGGFWVARRALAPIERMTERARSITADRLSDRLPVHNPDDEMGRLATVFNETLARLEQSFDQMRRFTADVSHELRTPLTSIRSVGEVGLRGTHRDAASYRSIIGSMLEEADRLAGLVDRLLTLSRAESGQGRLTREIVDLASLAEDVVSHLGVLAEEKGQRLTIEASPRRPSAVADRLVLRQALINLVDNAIKFSPAGGEVRIRLGETADEVSFEVCDSGPGISDEAKPRIFDRFYRSGESEAGGTGLGLSLAKGAVEANGGRLTLERTSAAGSTFRIIMPRHA
jgi:heavy metal sensor kinase